MKKLMIAAAIACSAVAAQAAQWTVINAGAYNGYKITTMAVCDSSAPSTFPNTEAEAINQLNNVFLNSDSAWKLSGSGSWADHYAFVAKTMSPPEITGGTATGQDPACEVGGLLSAVFMLCPDGIAPGKEYVLTKTLPATITGESSTFDFSNVETLASGNFKTDGPSPAPEPTSGMLMLFGCALLALKRKRA